LVVVVVVEALPASKARRSGAADLDGDDGGEAARRGRGRGMISSFAMLVIREHEAEVVRGW
jgi:hypothetical protein